MEKELKDKQIVPPPIGLKPKEVYYNKVAADRLSDICGAISRYYNAGLEINIEWIKEYNDLIVVVKKAKEEYGDI